MNELVSVIIPTYNRKDTIERAINSVLNQTYKNIEIIVVDDASTDDTYKFFTYVTDERVRYIRNDNNLGPARSRNKGVKLAKGKYIAFQDSDDEWLEKKLEKQMRKFQQNSDLAMVYCPYLYVHPERSYRIPNNDIVLSLLEGHMFDSLLDENKIGTPTMLIKREAFETAGGFDENIKALEDWEFVIRFSRLYEIGYVNEILLKAYYSENSVNFNYYNKSLACASILCKNKDNVTSQNQLLSITRILVECMIEGNVDSETIIKEYPDLCFFEINLKLIEAAYKKTDVWKKKYKALCWVIQKAKSYFKDIDEPVSIYGAGVIGMQLINQLSTIGIEIDCIIDRNVDSLENYNVYDLEGFKSNTQVKVVIITVPDEKKQILGELKTDCDMKVYNIYDLI